MTEEQKRLETARRERDGLSNVPTCELVEELRRREGVETHQIGPGASIKVKADGPAIVLAVID